MPGRRRQRAQALAEFALALPLFFMLVAGSVECGRALFAYGQLLLATQDGARYGAVVATAGSDAAIISRVQQMSPGGTQDTVTVSTTVSPTNNAPVSAANRTRGNLLTIQARHPQTVLIPFFPIPSFTMTATTSMVIE